MNEQRRISQSERRISELEKQLETAGEAWRELVAEILRMNERRERRLIEMAKLVVHALIAISLIAAYVIVTVSGNDGNALITILIGYLGGATVEGVANKRANRT